MPAAVTSQRLALISFLDTCLQVFVQRQQDVRTSCQRSTGRESQEVHTADVRKRPSGRTSATVQRTGDADRGENRAGDDRR